jgi:hypothetical protein
VYHISFMCTGTVSLGACAKACVAGSGLGKAAGKGFEDPQLRTNNLRRTKMPRGAFSYW